MGYQVVLIETMVRKGILSETVFESKAAYMHAVRIVNRLFQLSIGQIPKGFIQEMGPVLKDLGLEDRDIQLLLETEAGTESKQVSLRQLQQTGQMNLRDALKALGEDMCGPCDSRGTCGECNSKINQGHGEPEIEQLACQTSLSRVGGTVTVAVNTQQGEKK